MVRVALTGTPGVGKTTLAGLLGRDGWTVVAVADWAAKEGCVVARDDQDDADVVDVDSLRDQVPADDGTRIVYEGHLSHLLDLDEAWVIRCDPKILRARMEARGYAAAKVVENLEAEAMDLILQEAMAHCGRTIQRDGTRRSPEELLSAFVEAHSAATKSDALEPVDWSDQLPIW